MNRARGWTMGNRRRAGGFSLTEVVVSVGIFSLAITSLLGLMSIALSTQADSIMQTLAANTASEIVSRRRASPHAREFRVPGSGSQLLVVPPLQDIGASSSGGGADEARVIDTSGFVVAGGGKGSDLSQGTQFLCEYRGWVDSRSKIAMQGYTNRLYYIHLRLMWPVEVARNNPKVSSSYELLTMITEK